MRLHRGDSCIAGLDNLAELVKELPMRSAWVLLSSHLFKDLNSFTYSAIPPVTLLRGQYWNLFLNWSSETFVTLVCNLDLKGWQAVDRGTTPGQCTASQGEQLQLKPPLTTYWPGTTERAPPTVLQRACEAAMCRYGGTRLVEVSSALSCTQAQVLYGENKKEERSTRLWGRTEIFELVLSYSSCTRIVLEKSSTFWAAYIFNLAVNLFYSMHFVCFFSLSLGCIYTGALLCVWVCVLAAGFIHTAARIQACLRNVTRPWHVEPFWRRFSPACCLWWKCVTASRRSRLMCSDVNWGGDLGAKHR